MSSPRSRQRQAVADLARLALREIELTWPRLTPESLPEVLAALAGKYGDAAAALAADWYEAEREASRVGGRFAPVLAEVPDAGRWQSLAGWAYAMATSDGAALALVSGGFQRSLADQHRLTVARSSVADPAARGWARVGDGSSCDFCRSLIGRGGVYTSETADFLSHDHCGCISAPAFH